jgi:hypothetical protein
MVVFWGKIRFERKIGTKFMTSDNPIYGMVGLAAGRYLDLGVLG